MKIIKFLLISIFIILIGGFGYFAMNDVDVEQHEVTKEIPHEVFRER